MTLMPMYTAQWEMKAAMKDQRLVEAEWFRLARRHWSACEPRKPQKRSRSETSALKKLLIGWRYAGA